MAKTKGNKTIWAPIFVALGVFALIGAWYLLAFCLASNGNYGVPYPHETASLAFSYLFLEGALGTWMAIFWTLLRLVMGFVVSFVLGALFGILAGLFPKFKAFSSPLLGVLRAIPTAAVVLTLVSVLLGAKAHAWLSWIPVALTFVVAFPLYYQAFCSGIENESADILDSLSLEGANRKFATLVQVYLPDSWPFISMSLAQSLGLSFKVCIMAEVLSATSAGKAGIGTLIVLSRQADGGIQAIPAYSLIVLILMAVLDIPFLILRKKRKTK